MFEEEVKGFSLMYVLFYFFVIYVNRDYIVGMKFRCEFLYIVIIERIMVEVEVVEEMCEIFKIV